MSPPPTPPPKNFGANFGNTPVGSPTAACRAKVITARVVSVTFRSDHLDAHGKKLLRPSAGHYKDATSTFEKPEWDEKRGGSAHSHPISQTKNTHVKVDVVIEFTLNPKGCTAQVTKIKGVPATGGATYLTFEKQVSHTVGSGRVTFSGLVSKGLLPNSVELVDKQKIVWSVVADGQDTPAGVTGEHTIYVTFATPGGKMEMPRNNAFTETGRVQDVTEERLRLAVLDARGTGVSDEKECVDAVFNAINNRRVGYVLGRRYELGHVNDTGVTPKPTLHTYLWLCDAHEAEGECHNIAAAFALECHILGVKGAFEVGYMYPWPSRRDTPPSYPKRGDHILGKYNARYVRAHSGEHHGTEALLFLDGSNAANNFEGVAKYRNALYAIGDARFDLYGNADENASTYFAKRDWGPNYTVTNSDLDHGVFDLIFSDVSTWVNCEKPYPWKHHPITLADGSTATTFRWEE